MSYLVTFILPFFNEEAWIGATVASLVAQNDQRFKLLLVDNGSSDASAAIAVEHATPLGDRCEIIPCEHPGKTHALAAGMDRVDTPYVAICDADTLYPTNYVSVLLNLFAAHPKPAAVMAVGLLGAPEQKTSVARLKHVLLKAKRNPDKCHTGGYGQAFDTSLLRRAGGFDPARWPYVLEDHEIVYRVQQFGCVRYDQSLFCITSPRRTCRRKVSWSLTERLIYRFTPSASLDWFFYRFLGPRLESRGSYAAALREKSWISDRK
jgi:glycosyltransferase involved in cell wall biosynthesis